MAQPAPPPPVSARRRRVNVPGVAQGTVIALWLAALVILVLAMRQGALSALDIVALALQVAILPLIITIWLSQRAAQSRLGDDLDDLRAALGDMHRQMAQPTPILPPSTQAQLDALAAAQDATEAQIVRFISTRTQPSGPTVPPTDQPSLALDEDAQTPPPAPSDLIRALHFPEDENDQPGFDALRKALADPRIAPLIRAAQDVLTRLSQEGIYMDDLRPDRARPEFWRAFARGERGPVVAPLGGIRDRSCLALSAGRMRHDPDFRISAHLFLREFDRVFALFEAQADDAQIAAMADTRSARAFMLLGRVSGVFSRTG